MRGLSVSTVRVSLVAGSGVCQLGMWHGRPADSQHLTDIRQAGLARWPNTPSSPVFLYSQMSGYNWTWPQIPSLTAMKYQRHGYVETRPFELGERMCGRRGLERFVKGYRSVPGRSRSTKENIWHMKTNPLQVLKITTYFFKLGNFGKKIFPLKKSS